MHSSWLTAGKIKRLIFSLTFVSYISSYTKTTKKVLSPHSTSTGASTSLRMRVSNGEQFNRVRTRWCRDIAEIIYLFIYEIYFNPSFSVEKPEAIKGLMSLCAIHGQMNILTLLFNDPYRFLKPGPYILAVPLNRCFSDISENCKQNEGGIGSFIN